MIANLFSLPTTGLLPFVKVVDNFDAEYEYITNEGSVFTFKTNLEAPKYKLINIDFNDYKQVEIIKKRKNYGFSSEISFLIGNEVASLNLC